MIQFSYIHMVLFISTIWFLVRAIIAIKNRGVDWKRELQLMFVYICIIVVARFTFFPFSKVNGEIQPLVYESAKAFPPRINWIPLINLFDYAETKDILLNVIGNTTMFIPLGIVWPSVYKELNSHRRVIAAGIGFSLLIEILQLPFFDRVTDIDDLILNSLGFVTGYLVYLLVRKLSKKGAENRINFNLR